MNIFQKGALNNAAVVIIAIVIAIVGYFAIIRQGPPQETSLLSPTPLGTAASTSSPEPSPTKTAAPKPTATATPKPTVKAPPIVGPNMPIGWFKYLNSRYEFELFLKPGWDATYSKNYYLVYPKDSGVSPTDPQNANEITIEGAGCKCTIFIEETPPVTLEQWMKDMGYTRLNEGKVTVGGIPAYDVVVQLQGSLRRQVHLVYPDPIQKDVVLRVAFFYDFPGNEELPTPDFDTMLSTFKRAK